MSNVNNDGVLSYIGAVGAGSAWGSRLDAQASRITELSDAIGSSGNDQPSNMVALTAESLRMQFLSQNAATSQNSVAQALESLSKRQ